MSAISEQVRKSIFAALDVPTVVGSGKATGVFETKAPDTAEFPYVIFQRQAPGNVQYSFGPTNVLEDDLWLIKVLADKDSSQTKEPQELAEDILNLCESAIGNRLTLAINTNVWCARQADMPPYEEEQTDRYVYHRGFLLRVATV